MSEQKHFAVCVENGDYAGTLELKKLYEVIDDPSAEKRNYVRIIDESGEDYLYPRAWFLPVQLAPNVEEALAQLAAK
jgi:hypothetical protein